jgi:uncharacterized membrane protein YdjX (TVP38/TMEM64 family)
MRLTKRHYVFALLALAVIIGAAFGVRHLVQSQFRPEDVGVWIRSFGAIGPFVFVLLLAVAPLVFIPGSLLTAAAGLAYGWQFGIIVVAIGNNLCANLGFFIARRLGRERIDKLTRGRLGKIEERLGRAKFKTILSLRVMPIAPFQLINYGAGISSVKWKDYFWATLIGTLPGTFFFTYIGSHLHWRHPQLYFALGALFFMSSLPYISKWIRDHRNNGQKLKPHWSWGLIVIALLLWGVGGVIWATAPT